MADPEDTAPQLARRSTDLPTDAPWWARYLEANIKDAWRWASVRYGAFIAIAAEAYAADPAGVQDMVQSVVPTSWWPHIIAAGGVAAVFLRVVNLKGNKP